MLDDSSPTNESHETISPHFIEIVLEKIHDDSYIRAKKGENIGYMLSNEHVKEIARGLSENQIDRIIVRIQEEIIAEKESGLRLFREITSLPTAAKFLLYFSAPEEAIGCLEELYHKVVQDRGVREANIWLWCQVARSVVPFAFAAILRAIKLSDLLDWIFKTL